MCVCVRFHVKWTIACLAVVAREEFAATLAVPCIDDALKVRKRLTRVVGNSVYRSSYYSPTLSAVSG